MDKKIKRLLRPLIVLSIIVSLVLIFLMSLLFITPYEAILLEQNLDYMYYLNIAETTIYIVGILTGIFITLSYVYRNYTMEKITE